jgi:malonyl-CoA reductase/3-hydroxypropionate dehydrogenase (NADP+)
MVVDMPLDAWRRTLEANLVSNFVLMSRLVPVMKRQGSGYVLNVSSYFGGEKYVAVPYPNRADYAVSKAGQRAMAETLARFVGPEIQINAIAPGPSTATGCAGVGGRPGLFARRGRLILENRRLNAVWEALVEAMRRDGARPDALLALFATNQMAALRAPDVPPPLRRFADRAARASEACADEASCGAWVLTPGIARKLVGRLVQRGAFLGSDGGAPDAAAWADALPVAPDPFFPAADVAHEAKKVRDGVLGVLHLKRMPSELDVALATVHFMADRAVSGETFQPSGGLQQERSITERELFGRAKPERVVRMHGRTVWLIGEHLTEHLARAAQRFLGECHAGRVTLLTRTAAAAADVRRRLGANPQADRVSSYVVGDDVEQGIDLALAEGGAPACVVCTPMAPLPRAAFGDDAMDGAAFRAMVEANLTHHFRVARRVVLMDDVRLVLVSPDVPLNPTAGRVRARQLRQDHAARLHRHARRRERAAGASGAGQPGEPDATRRSEEPRDAGELDEELERFAHAVVLAGAPLPDADTSRYRSRIYRGLAITV